MKKTIKQCFDFGFEEMRVTKIDSGKHITHRREEFEDENGFMHDFFEFPIDKFERQFGVIVSFT